MVRSRFQNTVLLVVGIILIMLLVALLGKVSPNTKEPICYKGFQYMKDKNGALWIVSHKGQALTCNQ